MAVTALLLRRWRCPLLSVDVGCWVMRKSGFVVLVGLVLAGCQGFPGFEDASAASKPVAEIPATPVNAKPTAKAPITSAPTAEPTVVAPSIAAPTAPLPLMHTDAFEVSSGIVVPPLAENDARQAALNAEKAQVDHLVVQGAITREAAAKRLYKFAVKAGIVKGKADEDFWQSLIQAYRNLDDRYIGAEDAASDINAAAARRAAAAR